MSNLNEVLDAARTLTAGERLRLVEALWEDVSPDEWPAPTAEWIREAQRRSAEFDASRSSASPWREVQARSRLRAGLDG